ncbi:inositol monophosphatase family protein [Algihabitans albus]|uniref:inositol monophosphatase family protein n=1 Tax=Algihabitans albus TaxID=2164067 RepID=UPI000E5CF47B|nr:inositol monophosphatase [Algihabitans albus]
MQIDPQKVQDVIAEVAAEVVLPRFRALAAHEVRDKGVNDFVTVADEEAEAALAERLPGLLPGSWVLGEEMVARGELSMEALAESDAPVWVVDPVDGTFNFAHGDPAFAVIVALCRGEETLAGWIHDPVRNVTATAERGGGAWLAGTRLRVAPAGPPADLSGTLHAGFRGRATLKAKVDRNRGKVRQVRSLRCSGQEYMRLAAGETHFTLFSSTKPWDHLAGVQLHQEAGGASSLLDGRPYRPQDGQGIGLLSAPDGESWRTLRETLFGADWRPEDGDAPAVQGVFS